MKSPTLQTPLPPPSPSQIHKLISSQHDPLLALEIFNLSTSTHPTLRHPPSTFHSLIIKLARHRHFSLMHNLLSLLHSQNHPVPPSLLSHLLRIYSRFDLPEQALTTFHTSVLRLNAKPLPRHLNLLLQLLASRRHLLRPAFDLFKTAQDRYCVTPNAKSYNILMRAFCLNGDLSVAYSLFNQMPKRDVVPDVESYRILMQGLCRNSQVNRAVDLLGDMLNKGFVPDTLSYTTLLNSLCRKKKLKEAYKLLCRMKVKGCNPDIVHYNTVIVGFCREGRALDACKVLEDMPSNGCLPNLVSYRSLVAGLCRQGLYDEAENYVKEMMSKGFSPHFSVFHAMIKGFCNVGKVEEACGLLGTMLNLGESPHVDTWMEIIPRICEVDEMVRMKSVLEEILKVEVTPHMRIVEADSGNFSLELSSWELIEFDSRSVRRSNLVPISGDASNTMLNSVVIGVCPFSVQDAWQCDICGSKSGRGFDRSGDLESLMVKSTYPDPSISDLRRLVVFLYRSVPQLLYCAPLGCSDSKTAMPLTRFFNGELSCWIPRCNRLEDGSGGRKHPSEKENGVNQVLDKGVGLSSLPTSQESKNKEVLPSTSPRLVITNGPLDVAPGSMGVVRAHLFQ
ncbi:hypothetical protein RHMOL_Rhmol07G0105000 [Rhododendron molle]|uniref:Uncharacterized protein n=1 Tax=Rhododendron molle TaxID=49168 RepID=A0ACC0MZF7_RHOML|nr:hypothetical protein RHMOL_Rhmol07G0105000 [Rhododendron molle]